MTANIFITSYQFDAKNSRINICCEGERFNRREVSHFYQNLESVIEKITETSRLYNMDKTGISTTSNKPPKVLSVKKKKKISRHDYKRRTRPIDNRHWVL